MNNLYDLIYKDNENIFWEKPLEIIEKFLDIKKNWSIIDLWCWNWRNLLYLLQNWFTVIWVDSSKEAINIIKSKIEKIILDKDLFLLEKWIQDIIYMENFDYLLSYSLHFLREEQRKFLLNLKNKTSIWNFNIIETFLNEWKLSWNEKNLKIWELKEIYLDWEIYFYDEIDVFTMESNRTEKNKVARIIAKKK